MKKLPVFLKPGKICLSRIILFFAAGAALLTVFSIIQKSLAGYPLKLKGFIVPVIFGGISGIITGFEFCKLKGYSQKLAEARAFIESILDSLPSMLLTSDLSGNITHWNKTAENKLSAGRDKLLYMKINKALKDIIPDPDRLTDIIKSGKHEKWTEKTERDNRISMYNTVEIFPFSESSEKGAVIIITDITEEQIMKNQLDHSRKMDVIGQLAEGVAHDFNNMLGIISGAADLLKTSENKMDKEEQEYIRMILKSCTTAADLASKLMGLGRKNDSEFTNLEISGLINDSIRILKSSINRKISIIFENTAGNCTVEGDISGLQSALINLGINSSHAMVNGGGINICTEKIYLDQEFCSASPFKPDPGNYLKIIFRDTGCGMTEEVKNRIFEPFFTTKKTGNRKRPRPCSSI